MSVLVAIFLVVSLQYGFVTVRGPSNFYPRDTLFRYVRCSVKFVYNCMVANCEMALDLFLQEFISTQS